jgi:hypothetical protein
VGKLKRDEKKYAFQIIENTGNMKRIINNMLVGSLALVVMLLAGSCQKLIHPDITLTNATFTLNVSFKAVVDATPLEFDKTYANYFQEPYTVKTFKYYVSAVELLNTGLNKTVKLAENTYFLVDEAAPATTNISVQAPSTTYDKIAFVIGVDSTRNVSGAQTGALDPANGMFWTWNSGYIMAKLEGTSPLSTEVNNRIQYHIGGFKQTDNVLRRIVLPFPSGTSIQFLPNSSSTLTITANVNAWFNNPHELRIAQVPVCMTPGELSQKIADNYAKMFTLVNVVNN